MEEIKTKRELKFRMWSKINSNGEMIYPKKRAFV